MILKQRVQFYTKISIAFVVPSTIILYYLASKNNNLNYSRNTNRELSDENLKKEINKPNYTTNLKLTTRIEANFNFFKKSIELNETISNENGQFYRYGSGNEEIKLAVVLCGERLNQTLVTLKSVFIFSKKLLHLIIIADEKNQETVKRKLLDWPAKVLTRLSFEIHNISFPDGEEGNEWMKLFKLCACQRLFLPSLLQHIDSLLYIDTDVIFMRPVEDLWNIFHSMNSSQIAALSPEHEDFATGWYNRFARHPFYEPLGVNSGVMLMNLTRMRKFQWSKYLSPIMNEYKLNIVWGDQDIINIIFHFHPDKLYIFSCVWNFRPDHCMYSNVCKDAKKDGIAIVHGNRGVFSNNKQPAFKVIYETMLQYNFEDPLPHKFLGQIRKSLEDTVNTNCGKHMSAIFSTIKYDSSSLKNR